MFKSIVVGTDGSSTAREAVLAALEIARAIEGRLEIVCAYEPSPTAALREQRSGELLDPQWEVNLREEVDATLAEAIELARSAGVRASAYARAGDPADAILDVAEELSADLIIVGNKGVTGASRFLLGSVPNKVSHHAPCSVLIIRTR